MKDGPILIVFYKQFRLPLILCPVIFGLGLYLIPLAVSYLSNNLVDFLAQWYILPFVLGIAWVSTVFCWAYERYPKILNQLNDVLGMNKEKSRRAIEHHLSQVYSDRFPFLATIPFTLLVILPPLLIKFGWLPVSNTTSTEMALPYFFVFFLILAVLVGYHGGLGIYFFITHIFFIRKTVANGKFNLMSYDVSETLNRLSEFSFYSSLTWFIGAGIVTYVFVRYETLVSFFFLVLSVVLGIVWFILPQLSVRSVIVASKSELSKSLSNEIERYSKTGVDDKNMNRLMLRKQKIAEIRNWPFAPRTLNLELISTIIPVLFFILSYYHVGS